jgi:hypothetical protein
MISNFKMPERIQQRYQIHQNVVRFHNFSDYVVNLIIFGVAIMGGVIVVICRLIIEGKI